MKRFVLWILASLVLFTLPAAAEKKVALVIGNSDYRHAPALPNPTRDAKAMTQMLEGIGFTVISGTDLDRQGMADKIRQFSSQAEDADTVLYFYAGHGIQLDGQNYLIPVDANLSNEMDVKLSTLDIDLMLQQTPVTARVKLVLLDACRNNPFKEQIARSLGKTRSAAVGNGLAEMKPTFGTMIAYSTGPGEVALDGETANSPFTVALLKYLPEPGLEIGQAMTRVRAAVYQSTGNQQLPWENKNLTSDYYLVAAPAADTPEIVAAIDPQQESAAGTKQPPSWTEDNGQIVLWQAVKDSTDPVELRAYLDKYGNSGIFAETAKKRIAALEAKDAEPPQAVLKQDPMQDDGFKPDPAISTAEASVITEKSLKLGKTDKKILLIKLSALGFGTRSVGNEFDELTRIAIAKWQTSRGYPVTGYFNRFQYDALINADDEEVTTVSLPEPVLTEPAEERAPVIITKKSVPKADPGVVYKKPAKKAEPKVVTRKYVPEQQPEIIVRKPLKKKPAAVVVEKPVKRKKFVAEQQPQPVQKKKRRQTGGPVPKIGISINSGGGFGISLGF